MDDFADSRALCEGRVALCLPNPLHVLPASRARPEGNGIPKCQGNGVPHMSTRPNPTGGAHGLHGTGVRVSIIAVVAVLFAALLTPSASATSSGLYLLNGYTISIRSSWAQASGSSWHRSPSSPWAPSPLAAEPSPTSSRRTRDRRRLGRCRLARSLDTWRRLGARRDPPIGGGQSLPARRPVRKLLQLIGPVSCVAHQLDLVRCQFRPCLCSFYL
jgi:hypothetical protein